MTYRSVEKTGSRNAESAQLWALQSGVSCPPLPFPSHKPCARLRACGHWRRALEKMSSLGMKSVVFMSVWCSLWS